jgi:hypothetical protein
MKITVEIADPLLRKVLKVASGEGLTLRSLVERGLQFVVENQNERRTAVEPNLRKPFKLRNLSFKGNGLRPGLRNAPWSKILAVSYEPLKDDSPTTE